MLCGTYYCQKYLAIAIKMGKVKQTFTQNKKKPMLSQPHFPLRVAVYIDGFNVFHSLKVF
jgi:hypothetical protein